MSLNADLKSDWETRKKGTGRPTCHGGNASRPSGFQGGWEDPCCSWKMARTARASLFRSLCLVRLPVGEKFAEGNNSGKNRSGGSVGSTLPYDSGLHECVGYQLEASARVAGQPAFVGASLTLRVDTLARPIQVWIFHDQSARFMM